MCLDDAGVGCGDGDQQPQVVASSDTQRGPAAWNTDRVSTKSHRCSGAQDTPCRQHSQRSIAKSKRKPLCAASTNTGGSSGKAGGLGEQSWLLSLSSATVELSSPSANATKRLQTSAKVGPCAISALSIPCTAALSERGATAALTTEEKAAPAEFSSAPISTIWSLVTSSPVVSKSRYTMTAFGASSSTGRATKERA